jgi:hypothetical protein
MPDAWRSPARAATGWCRSLPGARSLAGLALLVAAGCGGDAGLVDVSGRVTLDGQPLAGAVVEFRPADGRPSAGTTDADGRYALRYTATDAGAVPGEHVVVITTTADTGGDTRTGGERVPARYNTKSELRARVDRTSSTHDFDLRSN